MKEQEKSVKKTNLSRRKLLGCTAAAAAFMIVPRHVLGGEAGPAPSEKLNLGSIGVRRHAGLQRCPLRRQRKHLCPVRRGRESSQQGGQAIPESQALPGFSRDAGQGAEEPQRRDRHHPRFHARHGIPVGHGARHRRPLPEAAHRDGLGSPPAGQRREEVQSRHPDGQPGLFLAGNAHRVRVYLGW